MRTLKCIIVTNITYYVSRKSNNRSAFNVFKKLLTTNTKFVSFIFNYPCIFFQKLEIDVFSAYFGEIFREIRYLCM